MAAVSQLTPTVGVAAACAALGVARASFYRQLVPNLLSAKRPSPARALTQQERDTVRDLLNSPRFVDAAPAAIQVTLLDEGRYLCSTRTMYRLLAQDLLPNEVTLCSVVRLGHSQSDIEFGSSFRSTRSNELE